MVMLSLTVVKWLNRLPFIAKLSSRTLWLCGTYFENHCIGGTAGLLVALVTMVLASSSFLPLWTCLRVETVALVQMRKMGLEGDMTLAGFLTLALKSCVMKAFWLVPLQ